MVTFGQLPSIPDIFWPVKKPDETADFSYDATKDSTNADGTIDPITTVTFATKPSGTGEIINFQLTQAANVITVWLASGVPGRNYVHRLLITTIVGRTFEIFIGQVCDATLASDPVPASPSPGFGAVVTWDSGDPGAIVTGAPLRLVDASLIATGTDQTTALPLGALTNVFTGGTAGAGGRLPNNVLNGTITVVNADVIDKLIYPQAGGSIGGAGINVPVIVSPGQRVGFVTQSGTQWFAA